MKRKTILTLSALAMTAAVGAFAIPALADGGPGFWGGRHCSGMRMDHGRRGMMMERDGDGRMGRMGGMGPMGMRAMSDNPVYKSFDTDGNGTVTAAEAEAGVKALHGKYDADGNGNLSATEFEALFAEVSKGFAKRPFAMLDADGNKEISADEMAFPLSMMARMRAWQDAAPESEPKQ